LLFLLALSGLTGQLADARAALANRKALAVLTASTLLIAINWGIYIFSVVNGRILESSLGYYINPLVNVLLASWFLGSDSSGRCASLSRSPHSVSPPWP
jgi:chloramphenicol-sensitive protein RarD